MKITDAVGKAVPELQRFLDQHKDEVFTAIELEDAGIKRARHRVLPKNYKQDAGALRLYGHPDALGAVADALGAVPGARRVTAEGIKKDKPSTPPTKQRTRKGRNA